MSIVSTMVLGDCLDVLLDFKGVDAALTVADLPYQCTRCAWDQSEIDLAKFWRCIDLISNKSYIAACFANWRFGGVLSMSNPKRFRYELVWRKSNITGFFSAKHQPLRNHEFVVVFGPGRTYNAQMELVGKDNSYRPKTVYGSTSRSLIYGGRGKQPHRQDSGFRYPRSVREVRSEKRGKSLHPTQKPVRLVDWLIRTYSNKEDFVVDPVSGSGTTAIACAISGRNCLSVEKDPHNFEIGLDRLRKFIHKEKLAVRVEVVR